MWLAKITYDLAFIRKDIDLFESGVSQLIREKRIGLQRQHGRRDAQGIPMTGHGEIPEEFDFDWDEVLHHSDAPFLTSVRRWETQSVAQEFVDFVVSQANYVTGVVEEEK